MGTKVYIILVLLTALNCTSKKRNLGGENVQIICKADYISINGDNDFEIINNSNNNFIINKNGFLGSSSVYSSDGTLVSPKNMVLVSPADWDDYECKNNILLIPKKSRKKYSLNLNLYHFNYDFYQNKLYTIEYESEHTLKSPYYYGCKNYVDSLVSKGYRIIEYKIAGKARLKL